MVRIRIAALATSISLAAVARAAPPDASTGAAGEPPSAQSTSFALQSVGETPPPLSRAETAEVAPTAPAEWHRLAALERSHELIINHYQTGLSFIGVLLAVVGILFPIVTYFTAILPTRREVEKLASFEARLQEKFNEFLASAEVARFNRLIEKATGTDSDARREAAARLVHEDSAWFTEQRVALLRTAIADEKDATVRSQLVHGALSRTTRHGDALVREIMRGKYSGLEGRALAYIARDPKAELIALIDEKLGSAEQPFQTAFLLLGGAAANREAMTLLLERPAWKTTLRRHELALLIPHVQTWIGGGYLTKEDLRASTLGDLLLGRFVVFWRVEKNQMVASDDPAGSEMAHVYEDGIQTRTVFSRQDEFRELVKQATTNQPPSVPPKSGDGDR